ncbi:hypothetical protein ACROYT_G024105, partial [Oculina patagonica]
KLTNSDSRMQPVSKYFIFSLRSPTKNPLLSQGFSLKTIYTASGKIDEITLEKETDTVELAASATEAFHKNYPTLVSASQVAVSRRKIFKIAQTQHAGCVAKKCETTVYQMLSNSCNDVKVPTINSVQLVCSASL